MPFLFIQKSTNILCTSLVFHFFILEIFLH
jgi:hypothetical protein